MRRRTRPLPPKSSRIRFSTSFARSLMKRKSKMILEDCLEASRKRFLMVFSLWLVGVLTSQIVPMIRTSGLWILVALTGLMSSILKPKSVKYLKVFSSLGSGLMPFLLTWPLFSFGTFSSFRIFMWLFYQTRIIQCNGKHFLCFDLQFYDKMEVSTSWFLGCCIPYTAVCGLGCKIPKLRCRQPKAHGCFARKKRRHECRKIQR